MIKLIHKIIKFNSRPTICRLAVFGVENSVESNFWSGVKILCNANSPTDFVSLRPENAKTAAYFDQIAATLPQKPTIMPTNMAIELEFTLKYANYESRLHTLEISGQALSKSLNQPGTSEQNYIRDFITDCECIFFLIPAAATLREYENNLNLFIPILELLRQNNPKLFSQTALVFTQSEQDNFLLNAGYDQQKLQAYITEKFGHFYRRCQELSGQKQLEIFAVSNFSKNIPNENPPPPFGYEAIFSWLFKHLATEKRRRQINKLLKFALLLVFLLLSGGIFRYCNDQKFLTGQSPWLPALVSDSAVNRKLDAMLSQPEAWSHATFSFAEIDQKIAILSDLAPYAKKRRLELQLAQRQLEQLYDEKLFILGNPESYLANPRGKKYVAEMRQKLTLLNRERNLDAMKLIDRLPLSDLRSVQQKIAAVENFTAYTDAQRAEATEICTLLRDFFAQSSIKITLKSVSGLREQQRTGFRIVGSTSTSLTPEYSGKDYLVVNETIQFTPRSFSPTVIEWWKLDWNDEKIAFITINTPLELLEKLGRHEMAVANWSFFSTPPIITLQYSQWDSEALSRYQRLLHQYIYPGTFWKIHE